MQLTKHTDFALRTLMFLSANSTRKVTILEISEHFNIPKSHLMKVVSKLVANDYVESIRGRYGGIKLSKSPNDIVISDVIILMEHTLLAIDCVGLNCIVKDVCRLRGVLDGAQQSYLKYLSKYSLADIMNEPTISILSQKIAVSSIEETQ